MDAVSRQRRANARRIAQAGVATAAVVVLGGGVAHAAPSGALRKLPVVAADRADAVSGVPTTIDLVAGRLPTEHALVALTVTPAHGRAVLHDDATATYTSAPGFTGSDAFSYRFTDERGLTSRVTVAVTVSHGNGPMSGYAASVYAA